MDYIFSTPLKGIVALTDTFHAALRLRSDKNLYKILWVQTGYITLDVDCIPITVQQGEFIAFTPLHHIEFKEIGGAYTTYLFNSNFYCIYGHDNEVSCNGLLFFGISKPLRFHITQLQAEQLLDITRSFLKEYAQQDSLKEEMLRIHLKSFIIICTRIARNRYAAFGEKEKGFEIVRQYYSLVEAHFREKKQVQEYAEILHRSPKTITNLFLSYGLSSPLKIIHERIEAEARRLLIYTNKSAKEIADLLGFEDAASFSRFFKNINGKSITEYRKNEK